MLRIILLLTPVYVSLFWGGVLAMNRKMNGEPRKFLSLFMFLVAFCFLSHFLYFAHLKTAFFYFDVPLQLFGSLIFPVFYLYFRFLTIDSKFSIKKHLPYILIPSILGFIYAFAVLFTPQIEYRTWLFDKVAYPQSNYIYFLKAIRLLMNIQFLLIVFAAFIASSRLLNRYADKAEEFYSDINDGKYNHAKFLNYTILYSCVLSFISILLGRYYIFSNDLIIYIIWLIFSITLYLIGYMGLKQKTINPTFEIVDTPAAVDLFDHYLPDSQMQMLNKMLVLFEEKKLYLNNELNILDVVKAVGTNRTYISNVINKQYNQNFCSFVNAYRIQELELVYAKNYSETNEFLSEACGFGSVKSMKRAILNKTGMSINEWKKQQECSI